MWSHAIQSYGPREVCLSAECAWAAKCGGQNGLLGTCSATVVCSEFHWVVWRQIALRGRPEVAGPVLSQKTIVVLLVHL